MNLENPDRQLARDNWSYVERDNWTPDKSRSLVVLYELQSPIGVASEDIHDMIHSKGPEVVSHKAEYRRFFAVFNCR